MPAQNGDNATIADILFNKKIINQESYELVKSEQINTGRKQESILKDRNLVDEKNLTIAKAEFYKIPFVDVSSIANNPQAINYLPQAVCQRFTVFPYDYKSKDNELFVVMKNPLDIPTLDFLENKSRCKIVPAFGLEQDIMSSIAEGYAQNLSTQVDAVVKDIDQDKKTVVDAKSLAAAVPKQEAPIAKIVSKFLSFAISSNASDIHIEPQEDKTRVRYRVDGILHEKLILPKNVHDAVVSRIKILSGMKIDEKRVPQDGRFSFRTDDQEVDLRVSTLPTNHGEKVVMRILRKSGEVPSLLKLGLRGMGLKNLKEAINIPHGVVLVTGPTGSGKTTTLYSMIHDINTPKVNIVTLEDPVEYEMPGVNQVQINPTAGLTFASGLRSILRQDPNIVMVGEIRDQETAELAVQASLTGHLVLSTLHTNSAAGALPRLLDMGIEPFLLASAINCVVAQRVVRRICPNCREEYKPDETVLTHLRQKLGPLFSKYDNENFKLYRGTKCSKCNDTGYSGRVGIFEVMPINEKIGRMIVESASTSQIERIAVENGMLVMQLDGYLKALEGVTTIEEVLRVSHV